jgi:ATP-dependent Lon protease
VTDPSVVEILPVLPLKNTVLFPYLLLTLSITKPSAMAAVDAALARADKGLVVVAQRSSATMKAQELNDLQEKVLAAHRCRIQRVILPRENEKDLREIPDTVSKETQFIFADRIEDVLKAAIPSLTALLTVAKAS